MDNPLPEDQGKTILILEDAMELESVEDRITALGLNFEKKDIVTNSLDLIEELKQSRISGDLLAVLIFLSKDTLLVSCFPDYVIMWTNLLLELKKIKSIIFIDNDNLSGVFLDTKLDECLPEVHYLIQDFKNAILNGAIVDKSQIPEKIGPIYSKTMKIYEDLTKFNRVNYVSDSAELNSSLQLMGKTAANLKYLYGAELKPGGFKIELEFDVIISNLNQIIEIIENFQLKLLFKLAVRLQLAMQLLDAIQKSGAEIVSYKKKKEVTIEAHHFLDEIDRGTFLHLYVPKGRYQEDQLASLLRLFESYLQRIENLPFFIDSRKTSHGRLYEFKSKNNSVNLTDMEIAFSRFENFMNLCQNDLKNAETLLLRAGISPSEVSGILAKYMKEYQRLLLDTEQERKRKLLDIGLRLESDIFEYTNATDIELLQSIQPTSLLSLTTDFDPINITIYNSSVSLNSGTQSFIEQAIYGDIHYTPQDRELIHLFEKYAERFESVQLRSKLEELKDTSIPETERKTAMKKIVGFLYNKVAPAVSQSALTLLTTYLQKVLTGS